MSQIPIFTIGYGRTPIATFIQRLQAHQIDYLIDVRSQPHSRHQPDFSKEPLQTRLTAAGIRYVFMGDTLGGRPTDPACLTNGEVDYDKVARQDFYQRGIGRLQDAQQQQLRVALMCAEAKPEQCHRTHLIGRTLTDLAIPLRHIDEDGSLLTQDEVLARHQAGQMALFAAPAEMPPPPPDLPPPDFDDFFMDAGYLADDSYPIDNELAPYDAFIPDELLYGDAPPPDMANLAPPLPPFPAHTGQLTVDSAAKLLKQVFGFDEFRPLQADVIQNLLDGQDALAIMPTGSGKSLCYQLPALMFPGLTVVVSPLISLMADQVMQLREFGVPAVALNSSLPLPDYQWAVQQIRSGAAKLLYAAPETLVQPRTMALLEQVRVDCFTIDEAHCISEWGHDFRPEYRQLVDVRRRLPDAVCLAVTATATERVRSDIKTNLGIADADAFIASFNRENLFLGVSPKVSTLAQTLAFLQAHKDESGIIYCATRKQVDELAAQLQAHGWDARPYHAGLDAGTRQRHQEQFSRDDVPIIVATVAFGMGINKSNVRFILHVDLPKNLESYYQQIGRAGRDGLRADCLLLYSYSDVNTINFFITQQAPSQQAGARARLDAMLAFVESNECRRRPLLTYFDEAYTETDCGMCDTCTTTADELVDVTIPAQKFLSCVKRTGELFGANHIIDVLRGSQSQKIVSRNHHKLSTYNIGNEFSKREWQFLARQFIQQGLLTQDVEYGSLKLTAKAYDVFRGEAVQGTLPQRERRETATAVPHNPELFQLLRSKRKELADAANLPPYTIFSDKTLVEMASFYPQSPTAFAALYGVGAAKLEKYADIFLPLIRDYCAAHDIAEKRRPVAQVVSSGGGSRQQEVVGLWNDGRSLTEIADQYQVKLSTITGHLWKAIQAGEPVRSDNGTILAASSLNTPDWPPIMALFAQHGPQYLRPIFDALNERVSYEDLHIARLHFVLNEPPHPNP